MGRSPYQSEKRRKELARLQKQEEKRQKRFAKRHATGDGAEEGSPADGAVDQPSEALGTGDGAAPGTGTPPDAQAEGSPGGSTPAS